MLHYLLSDFLDRSTRVLVFGLNPFEKEPVRVNKKANNFVKNVCARDFSPKDI